MEVARLSSADQGCLEALPQWQRSRLEVLGIEAGSEVTLGRRPAADPRLVAAARILAASDEAQLQGHNTDDLGAWNLPIQKDAEVWAPGFLEAVWAVHCLLGLWIRLLGECSPQGCLGECCTSSIKFSSL